MQCPDCSGPMWDNRETKKSPKQPDYKCKNKQCDKAVWLQARGAANGETSHAPAPSNGNGNGTAPHASVSARPLGPLYNECLEFSIKACSHYFKGTETPADVIASAATLFIQAVKDGGPIRAPKAAPPPPPPPPPPVLEYDQYEDSRSLPF